MNRPKRTDRHRGFTLLEIIIAIAVLALLGSLSLVAVTSAMKYMKKVRRAARVDQVVKALEIYKQRYGEYPPSWPEFRELSEEASPEEQAAYAVLLDRRYAAVRRHVLKRWPKAVEGMPATWTEVVDPETGKIAEDWFVGHEANPSPFDVDPFTAKYPDPADPKYADPTAFDGKTALEYWLCTAEEKHGEAPILEKGFFARDKDTGQYEEALAYFRARPSKGQFNGDAYLEKETVAGRSPLPRYAKESYQLFAPGEDGELGTGDDLANFTGGMTVDEFQAENE